MIETQLQTIADNTARLANVEALLRGILDAVQTRESAPAPTAKPEPKPPAAEPEPGPEPPTLAEVRDALLALTDRVGRDGAVDVLGRFVPDGAAVKLSSVDPSDYRALLDACSE